MVRFWVVFVWLVFTDELNQTPLFISDESVLTQEKPSHVFDPPQFHLDTQPPASLRVSRSCFTQLSQPCSSDTRPFPFSSPLNKYVLWSPSQNTLACTHAHSQSALLFDTDPEDSKGALKVGWEGRVGL